MTWLCLTLRNQPAPSIPARAGSRNCPYFTWQQPINDAAPNKVKGLFYGGSIELLGVQALATLAVLAYSFSLTWVIAKALDATMGLRINESDELHGIHITAHSETAYLSDEEPVERGSGQAACPDAPCHPTRGERTTAGPPAIVRSLFRGVRYSYIDAHQYRGIMGT
ncbi:MAG: ammonia channel protein [Pseudarthrobacter sp.]|nr:ammonia channel protein [Pseudarthrobacter sp.]